MKPLDKLDQISSLKHGWNGKNAKIFSSVLIEKVKSLVAISPEEPEIFPTADGNIQLEFSRSDGSYLEISIGLSSTCEIYETDKSGKEKITSLSENVLADVIADFLSSK